MKRYFKLLTNTLTGKVFLYVVLAYCKDRGKIKDVSVFFQYENAFAKYLDLQGIYGAPNVSLHSKKLL